MNSPDPNERAALVEQRKELAYKRDKVLQDLLITHDDVEEGLSPESAMATVTAEAEAACNAVIASTPPTQAYERQTTQKTTTKQWTSCAA